MADLELEAARARRNPWMTAASCIPWALIPVLLLLSWVTGAPFFALTPHLAIIGALVFTLTWRRKPRALSETVRVRVTPSELRIADEIIPREAVKVAELLPGRPNPVVRVAARGRARQDVIVRDEKTAHVLLKALGFDPSQTTATYRLQSLAIVRHRYAPLAVIPIVFLAAMLAGSLHAPWIPALLPFLIVALLLLFLVPARLVVGVDGLLLQWLWMREFIPTKEIADVRRFVLGSGRNRVSGVELGLRNGRAVKLPIGSVWGDDAAGVVQQRVEDVLALAKGSAHVAEDALLLARGDLEVRDWIGRLKAIGTGATATLRTAPVMPERLWRVARDPEQAPLARAAAAVALAPSLDQGGRVRLAEVAKTTAAPKLRVALERAASDASEEEIEEALREIERG